MHCTLHTREALHRAPLENWSFRCWVAQAKRLYRDPNEQRHAVLHHIDVLKKHAHSPERWQWLEDLARALDFDRAGAGARGRGEL